MSTPQNPEPPAPASSPARDEPRAVEAGPPHNVASVAGRTDGMIAAQLATDPAAAAAARLEGDAAVALATVPEVTAAQAASGGVPEGTTSDGKASEGAMAEGTMPDSATPGAAGGEGRRPGLLPRVSDKAMLLSSSFINLTLRVGTVLIVSRWVPRAEQGQYVTLLSAPAMIAGFSDLGATLSITQMRDVDEVELRDTAMATVHVTNVVYAAAFIAGGVYYAGWFHSPKLIGVSVMIAFTTAITRVYVVQLNLLNRNMRFRAESLQNLILAFTSAATGMIFALAHFGIFALALQAMVSQLMGNLFIIRRVGLHFPRHATWRTFKRFWRFSWTLTIAAYITSLEGMLINNVMSVRIAGRGGAEGLTADFSRANQLTQLCSSNVNSAIERVSFTSLCANVGDRARFRQIAVRSVETYWLINVFVGGALMINHRDAIHVMLGSQYAGIIDIVMMLSLIIPGAAISSLGFNLAYAMGRTAPIMVWAMVRLALNVALMFSFARSPQSLAGMYVLAETTAFTGLALTTGRRAGLKLSDVAPQMLRTLLCGTIAAGVMWGVSHHSPALPALVRVGISVCLGGLAYLAMLRQFNPEVLQFARRMTFDRNKAE